MKKTISLLLLMTLLGCATTSQKEVSIPPKLDDYFYQYCGYTGNLGIGFVASHTYDSRYRSQLAKTDDVELKRLYVIMNLYQDLEWKIREFEQGERQVGKNLYEPLSAEEIQKTRALLNQKVEDLKSFVAFTNFTTQSSFRITNMDEVEEWWIEELEQKINNPNQQVDPIVKTPVDEVEAQGTQGHP